MKTDASVAAHSESNPNVENLDRLNILEIEFKRMAKELAALRSNGNAHHNANGSSFLGADEATALTDRRGMLKKVGALAAGVATAGLLRPTTASANNGDPFLLGESTTGTGGNSATSPTRAVYLGAASSAALFLFEDGTFLPGTSDIPAVLAGWARGGSAGSTVGVYGKTSLGGAGVYGFSTENIGVGVAGVSENGPGGFFEGGQAAISLLVGTLAVADPNVSNPPGGFEGDVYRGTTNGSLWYRTSVSAGTYRRLADDTTAGALTPFAASSRFVNLDPLGAGVTHAYQIGGMTVTGNTVPAKARAIVGRIADANPTGGGGGILVSATNPPPAGTGARGHGPCQYSNRM